METPNQIAYGLGAFLIAVVTTSLLANVLVAVLPAGVQRFTGAAMFAVFILAWWVSFLVIVHAIRRRRRRKQSQGT